MDERRRRLQEQVRRESQKRVTAQRITWSVIAIVLGGIAIYLAIILMQSLDKPERHARKFIATASTRAAYKTPDYSETVMGSTGRGREFPSFYDVELKEKKVLQSMGPEGKEVAVDVILQFQGEMVAGTSAAKQRREAGQKGPTHYIVQHWQKQRNGQLHPKGEWKVLATEIVPIP